MMAAYISQIFPLFLPASLKLWHLCHKMKYEIEKSLTDKYTHQRRPLNILWN